MNKAELVNAIALATDLPQKHINQVLKAYTDIVMEAVALGEKVTLVGFGTLEKRTRKQREGRNPATGEKITIPETHYPGFKVGADFDKMLNS